MKLTWKEKICLAQTSRKLIIEKLKDICQNVSNAVAQDQKHVPNVGTRPVCGRRVFNIMIN